MNERVEAAMVNRTEACLRAIVLALHQQRRIGEDGRYADRAQILNLLREIKAKAIEGEHLLHSLDRRVVAR